MHRSTHELRRAISTPVCAGDIDPTSVRQRRVARRRVRVAAAGLLMGCLILGSHSADAIDQQPPPDELGKPLDVAIKDVKANWYPGTKPGPTVAWTPEIPESLTQHQAIVLDVAAVSNPDPGAAAGPPPSITYEVGTVVPDLTEGTLAQARGLAREFGFTVTTEAEGADIVTNQVPRAGKPLPFGSTITLTLAAPGPRTIPVPRLRGLSEAAARAKVDSVGLRLAVTRSSEQGPFKVVRQDPSPGTFLGRGLPVRVTLVGTVGQVMVPDLTGDTRRQATGALSKLGLELRGEPTEDSRAAGVVSHQDPPPGTVVDLGATVTVVLSQPISLQQTSSPWGLGGAGTGVVVLLLLVGGLGTAVRRARRARRRHQRRHPAPALEVRPRQDSRPVVNVHPAEAHGDVALAIRPVAGATTTTVKESR